MQNLKKINSIYIKLLFVIFVYILAAFLCSYQHIDSDYSNLVLEANDIINGNIFLKNWTLTGISFITTDLLFFIIGAIFTGISDVSFKIAIAGMVATLICLSFFLASDGLKTGGVYFTFDTITPYTKSNESDTFKSAYRSGVLVLPCYFMCK